jgi:hypothetical protein
MVAGFLTDRFSGLDESVNVSAFNLLGLVVGDTNNTQFFSRLHEMVMIAGVSLANFMGWYVQMVLRLLTNERLLLAFGMIVLGFAFFAVWGWVEVITQGFFTIWFHRYVWFHEDEQRLMLWNTVLWGSPGWVNPHYKEYGNGSVTTVGMCGVKTWSGWFTGMMRGFSGMILSRGDEEYSYRYCGVYGAAVKGE